MVLIMPFPFEIGDIDPPMPIGELTIRRNGFFLQRVSATHEAKSGHVGGTGAETDDVRHELAPGNNASAMPHARPSVGDSDRPYDRQHRVREPTPPERNWTHPERRQGDPTPERAARREHACSQNGLPSNDGKAAKGKVFLGVFAWRKALL